MPATYTGLGPKISRPAMPLEEKSMRLAETSNLGFEVTRRKKA